MGVVTEEDLFNIWSNFENAENKKELTCCDDIANQEIAESGYIVCVICGTELQGDIQIALPSDYEMYNDYEKTTYKPYITLNNLKKKVRQAMGAQRVVLKENLKELTQHCKTLSEVKQVLKAHGAQKQYKNAYKYLNGKVPEWLMDMIFTIIYAIVREYNKFKTNKKKMFPFMFMARECTKLIMKWLKIDLRLLNEKYFPRMKHVKSEMTNLKIWLKVLSEINLPLLSMDMRRILVCNPDLIREIAQQNSYQLDPYSSELEDSRLSIINSFEDYKMEEEDRVNRLSAPSLALRLQTPEEKIKNLQEASAYKQHDESVQSTSSGPINTGQPKIEPISKQPVMGATTTQPIKNIEVIDPGYILPKNSIASIRSTIERVKALHSKEKEQRIIVQKIQDIVKRNV